MTMSDERRSGATVIGLEPRRLREGHGAAAEAVRAFHFETAATSVDEAAHWYRLTFRLRRPTGSRRGGLRPWLAGVALAAGAAAAVWFFWASPGSEPSVIARMPPRLVAPKRAPAPTVTTSVRASGLQTTVARRLTLSGAPRALPAGAVELDEEAHAELAPGGRAVASTDAGNTRVSLVRGSLRLDVAPSEPGRRFAVQMGPYRAVVAGASFRIARSGPTVDLWVSQGHVTVWRAEHRGPLVAAGEHWAGTLPPEAVRATEESAARATAAPSARADARATRAEALAPCEAAAGAGHSREALDCYRRIDGGTDLAAELALYEAARLELRLTGDARAALETLDAYERRFPLGSLRAEVELTRVELLPRVGEHRRALELSERLLREHPDQERWRDLRLLRGNIFREALGDYARAEPEYRAAADGGGRASDDAAFYDAVCLELLGRAPEAVRAYEAYLGRPHPAHEAEARKRLSTLAP
jgi:ferric-dicitrate binding protein FerR (iron transport regulator)